MATSWRSWGLAAAGVVLGAAAVIYLSSLFMPHMFAGTRLETPQPAFNFSLNGPAGRVYQLADYQGKVVLIFFGYTSCPDVCPTTMKELAGVLKSLGDAAEQVQVLMISVDPEKDTPERLEGYLSGYDARMIGLSGSLEQTSQVAKAYGVFYEKQPYGENGGYLVDHTAYVFLIDQRGDEQVIYPFGSRAQDIAADVRYILKH
jgi:protein SCO1/2